MKIVIDLLGAPASSGGMRTYAEELVWTWALTHGDELHLVGDAWISSAFGELPGTTVHVVPTRGGRRVTSQWFRAPQIAAEVEASALHSISPVVGPVRRMGLSQSNTIHDWRHLARPEEFGLLQRTYRRTWTRSTRASNFSVQISTKTLLETQALVPEATCVLAPNGADHARRWRRSSHERPGSILTFGHHLNKRPDLVIRALPLIRATSTEVTLTVLGATGSWRSQLMELSRSLGVDDRVRLPGFVEEREYQRIMQESSVVVLASSDEGFGLPVAEAATFGIPVVSSDDNGLVAIHGSWVDAVPPDASSLAGAIGRALARGRSHPRRPRVTWRETTSTIRNAIVGTLDGGSPLRIRRDQDDDRVGGS